MGARDKAKHKAENKGKAKENTGRAAQEQGMRAEQARSDMQESGARDAADRAKETFGE